MQSLARVIGLAALLMALISTSSPSSVSAKKYQGRTHGTQSCNDRDLKEARLQPKWDSLHTIETRREKTHWLAAKYGPKFVAVVSHGLNSRPSAMNDISVSLTSVGGKVLQVGLPAHRGFPQDNQLDPYTSWIRHLRTAFCLAREQAHQHNVPLVYVAYSMSSPLYIDLLGQNTEPSLKANAQVLFAPAISLRWTSYLVKAFYVFGEEYFLSSWGPEDYLASRGAKMKQYKALFQTIDNAYHHVTPKIHNIPTLVFIDPEDELVSPSGIQEFIRKNNLDQWKVKTVNNEESKLENKLHHLIIDQISTGRKQWAQIRRDYINHIYNSIGIKKTPLSPTTTSGTQSSE